MVQRTQRASGTAFYGCRRYPLCKGTLPVRDTRQDPLPGLDAERLRLLDTLYWERCENTRLAQQVTALRQQYQAADLARQDLERELRQLKAARQAPPATSAERQALFRELTRLLTLVHPDKWQDHPCALELTKHLVTLRDRVREGQ